MKLPQWLTLIFVVAKLTGYLTWSWWVVFSPVMVSLAVGLLFYALDVDD